ncbi:MAG: YmdB family metallophosphoesterase [Candidatus Melainabacteria bacterium]
MDILFFGDMVGRPGREAVTHYLTHLRSEGLMPDIVIANAENTTHGFGINRRHYNELMTAGVDILTGGNHIWDRQEIFEFIDEADRLLRPDNFPAHAPGQGGGVFTIEKNGKTHTLGVMNLIGQVFMGNYNSPWDSLERLLPALKAQTPVVFLDIHAEATAEKMCMAHFAATMGLSAMVGTHTHCQTADNRIIAGQLGYITDAGFNGAYNSIIGMEPEGSIKRLRDQLPARLGVAEATSLQVNAVRFTVESRTGVCQRVRRINTILDLSGYPADIPLGEACP